MVLSDSKQSYEVTLNHITDLIQLASVFILLTAYYPLSFVVQLILPKYTESLKYFYILAPGIALTSSISVVKHNYYKTLNKNKTYLIIGLITLTLQMIVTYTLFRVFDYSVIVVTIVTVIIQVIWYLITEIILNKKLNTFSLKNNLYIIVSTLLFYIMTFIGNIYIEFLLYGAIILLITITIYFKEIKNIFKKYINKP